MWKSFILLLWLIVPLCGYQFYRADYTLYQRDCQEQRRDCTARAEILERYTAYYEQHARAITGLSNRYDTRAWLREWQMLLDAQQQEVKGLTTRVPAYYPQAGAALADGEKKLAQQQQAIEQAQRQQGFALDLTAGLNELQQLIYEAQSASAYYRNAGSDSIYMFLQEILAQREAAYYSRQREYDGFLDNVAKELAKSKRLSLDVQRATAQLQEKLKLDEQHTYREELRQRFASFNLGKQLGVLLDDLV
jgi:hypothetical protein